MDTIVTQHLIRRGDLNHHGSLYAGRSAPSWILIEGLAGEDLILQKSAKKLAKFIGWTLMTEIVKIPPFGEELHRHLDSYKGAVKQASCSAWNLLYQLLMQNNLPVSKVSFNENGKPYFSDSLVHFSISHSKGLCAAAVSDRPIGVDIELCKAEYNPRLIERSLTEKEQATFDGDFTRLWCRKEAVAKMTGEGIIGYPNYIDTTAYKFNESLIEYKGQKYWLVAVEDSYVMNQGKK